MALRLYFDADGNRPVEAGVPDALDLAIIESQDLENTLKLYIKSDDSSLTYRNVSIYGLNDVDNPVSGEVNVQHAEDNGGSPGSFLEELELPDGPYIPAVPVWRKIYSPNLQSSIRNSSLKHAIKAQEFER